VVRHVEHSPRPHCKRLRPQPCLAGVKRTAGAFLTIVRVVLPLIHDSYSSQASSTIASFFVALLLVFLFRIDELEHVAWWLVTGESIHCRGVLTLLLQAQDPGLRAGTRISLEVTGSEQSQWLSMEYLTQGIFYIYV
jgi:hypothetical protein